MFFFHLRFFNIDNAKKPFVPQPMGVGDGGCPDPEPEPGAVTPGSLRGLSGDRSPGEGDGDGGRGGGRGEDVGGKGGLDPEPEPGSVNLGSLRGLSGDQIPGEGDGDGGRGGGRGGAAVHDGDLHGIGLDVTTGGLDPEPEPGAVKSVRLRGLADDQSPGEVDGDGWRGGPGDSDEGGWRISPKTRRKRIEVSRYLLLNF